MTKLGAELTGHAEPRVRHIEKHTVVLLLQIGYHIKHRVDVVWCGCHGQACDAAGSAVDKQVVCWQ